MLKHFMKNKKTIAVLLLIAMLFSIMPTAVWANEPASTTAYVTIVNQGEIVASHESITVTTGSAIIDDFLQKIHNEHHADYVTTVSNYGLSITTLWGNTSGAFGYYVNDASAWSLADAVKDGDHIVAFIYNDKNYYSDVYSYFNTHNVVLENGHALELELKYCSGYDTNNNYAPIMSPLCNATITLDGKTTTYKTDTNGKVMLYFPELSQYDESLNLIPETHIISAIASENKIIVPPVCEVTVKSNLTDEDIANNAIAANSSQLSNAVSAIQSKIPFVMKTNDNLLTIVTELVNNSRVNIQLSAVAGIVNADGKIIANNNQGAASVPFTIRCGSVSKELFVPIIVNGLLADSETLLHAIAASYTDSDNKWNVMDMGTYAKLYTNKYKLSDTAMQKYINTIIAEIQKNNYGESDYSTEVILPLTSIGVDASKLYPVNSNTPINAVDKLKNITPYISEWITPYTLIAYHQGYGAGNNEETLLRAMLDKQNSDGGWGSVDSTGEMLATLSFYQGNETVDEAIDKAVDYLRTQMRSDGVYTDGWNGYNANSTAMAVIGLSAVYEPAYQDLLQSSLNGLLSFAVNDNSGFWKSPDVSTVNPKATEQGFRALIAASQVMKTGQAYNVYDFSGTDLQPGRATGSGVVVRPSQPSSSDKITVTMSIRADKGYWMKNQSIKVAKDAMLYDAFTAALDKNGLTQDGAESGYVRSITYNNRTLGEFDLGANSGWLYQVNGTLPNVGLLEYALHDGDNILWYYTEDWTEDPQAGTYGSNKKEENKTEENDTTNTELSIGNIFPNLRNHWAANAIQTVYNAGLMRGVTSNDFAAEATFNRAMMATILHRLEGMPMPSWQYPFLDVADTAWYTAAIAWAYQNNLAGGVSDTAYAPESPITREQLAVMLMRYAQYKGYDVSSTTSLTTFQDNTQVSDYAKTAVEWAVAIGLISGRTDDLLAPQESATRAEVAVMLERFLRMFHPELLESAETSTVENN